MKKRKKEDRRVWEINKQTERECKKQETIENEVKF